MVYKDLKETIYRCKIEEITFYFSSEFYLRSFKSKAKEYINNEELKLKIAYRIYASNFKVMLLLTLYRKIEKRGFRVEYKGKEIDERYKIEAKLERI